MKRKIILELEFEDEEFDALQDEADFRFIKTVEEYLEVMIRDQVACSMAKYEAILSEEELREFRNEYDDEDRPDYCEDDVDPEIPF